MKLSKSAGPSSRWRSGVYSCSFCRYESKGDYFEWNDSKFAVHLYIGYPVTSAGISVGKTDSIIVEAECPWCFKKSWCHLTLHRAIESGVRLWGYPTQVIEALKTEAKRRIKAKLYGNCKKNCYCLKECVPAPSPAAPQAKKEGKP